MSRPKTAFLLICLVALTLIASPSTAQLLQHGMPVTESAANSISPVIVADGAGGVIVVWETDLNGNDDIYAQRFDDHGVALWTANGVPVCTQTESQTTPEVVEDGSGGVFIIWQDFRSGGVGIYGQRLSADGVPQWTANGIPIAWDSGTQAHGKIAYDGFGGAVVVWEQFQIPYYQIRGQRVSAGGALLWGSGVQVGNAGGHQRYPELVILPAATESETRVTVAWRDYRYSTINGADIFAQRVTLSGLVQWNAAGEQVQVGSGDQLYPELVASNSSSTIISWRDLRDDDDRGFCQRLDRYGAKLWDSGGRLITWCSANDLEGPKIASDGAGGVLVSCGNYGYRIDASGATVWGLYLYTHVSGGPYNGRPVRLDNGDCVIVAHSAQSGETPQKVIAYLLDEATGYPDWGFYGVPLCEYDTADSPSEVHSPADVVFSGNGVWATWQMNYWGSYTLLQRVELTQGYWGFPTPVITALEDVPQDEGGWLQLNVRAPSNDTASLVEDVATGYNVWRRIDPVVSKSALSTEETLARLAAGDETAGLIVTDAQTASIGLPAGDWESIGFHAALQQPYYDLVVPTRTDATDGSEPFEVLAVTMHTVSPTIYFSSEPDSAYSVDNLAPGMLAGLAGVASYQPEGLQLSWDPNPASDLDGYQVHRSTEPGFTPGPGTLVFEPTEAHWFDPAWSEASGYEYQVAAVDRHGNIGGYAALRPAGVTAISEHPRLRPGLAQNFPNPFNAHTSLRFALDEEATVTLRIYDAAGRLVKTLVDDETFAPGVQSRVWDGTDQQGKSVASGAYIARLSIGSDRHAVKMILAK